MGWHVQWSQWRCKSAAFTATDAGATALIAAALLWLVAADSTHDGLARAVEPVALLWALRWLWFGCKPLEQCQDGLALRLGEAQERLPPL